MNARRATRGLLGAALALLLALPSAAPAGEPPPAAGSERCCGTFSVLFENDLFADTDRNYTNGIKLSWVSEDLRAFEQWPRMPAWVRPLFERMSALHPDREKNLGLFAGQKLFTPSDIRSRAPLPGDRPYAAWLYTGAAFHMKNRSRLDTFELQLGWVGPAALGEQTQNFVHRLRDIPLALGWDNQLHNEPGVVLVYQHKRRLWLEQTGSRPWGAEMFLHYGAAAGNVFTYANTGVELRAGWNLPADFGTSLIRPGGDVNAPLNTRDPLFERKRRGFGAHVFAALTGRLVLRDLFLQGNTFGHSPGVHAEHWVGDLVLGVSLAWRDWKLSYSQVFRSQEFRGQGGGSEFGSISVSVNF